MKTYRFKRHFFLTALLSLWGFAGLPALSAQEGYLSEEDFYNEEIDASLQIYDPLEAVNRYTFEFNDFVYMRLLQPTVDVYTAVAPEPVQKGTKNFFYNLKYPVRLVGNLLQGRLKGAWVETGRFAINSTVGLVGVMTPADAVDGFEPIKPEDVGQAMGAWGIGEGPYLILPLLGPSNLRDFGGLIGDRAVHPLREPFSVTHHWNWEWRLALTGSELIAISPDIMQRYKQFKGSAIDPYSSMKNGFTQYRRGAVAE